MTAKATPQATQSFVTAFPHLTYQSLSQTGLFVSQAGFGCYRVDVAVESHQEALRHALLNGINLIDTSSNYADGGSEEAVGQVVADLVDRGQITREAVVVVSKVGYLQGQNYALSQERKEAGRPFPDLVEYADGLEHCLHPEFISDQLTRSLARLDMAVIDCYLLHNPEYYLGWAHKAGMPLAEARTEYYRRIELAFRHLEEEVVNGRIQTYGISSNTFPSAANNPQFTSLERCWTIAERISPNHHFRVIQLPMNLIETGGATETNQSNGRSVLQFAHEKGMAVLINRPLNAIYNNELMRLANVPRPQTVAAPDGVSTAVDRLQEMEVDFQQELLPQLGLEAKMRDQLGLLLMVGTALNGRWSGFNSYTNWQSIVTQNLIPRTQQAVSFLSNQPDLPTAVQDWVLRYVESFNVTMQAISGIYQDGSATWAAMMLGMAEVADEEWRTGSLSQTAVRALRSTKGVTAVLVGMRQTQYVDDVLAELNQPIAAKNRDEIWEKLGIGV
jgi:aryl-alcohol dehydrogenase-like predicted oxidoreductase